jgi:hypothetical protein
VYESAKREKWSESESESESDGEGGREGEREIERERDTHTHREREILTHTPLWILSPLFLSLFSLSLFSLSVIPLSLSLSQANEPFLHGDGQVGSRCLSFFFFLSFSFPFVVSSSFLFKSIFSC